MCVCVGVGVSVGERDRERSGEEEGMEGCIHHILCQQRVDGGWWRASSDGSVHRQAEAHSAPSS